jgi:hypothetical protein
MSIRQENRKMIANTVLTVVLAMSGIALLVVVLWATAGGSDDTDDDENMGGW